MRWETCSRHAGPRGRVDGLADGLGGAAVAAPRVGGVERPAARRHRAQALDLGGGRGRLRGVLQAGRVAPRALLERLLERARHRRQLVRRGGAVREADRRQPQLPVRDEAEHVDGRAGALQPLEVAGRRAPVERHRVAVPVHRRARRLRVADGEAAVPAVADGLQRHALVDRAAGARVHEQRVVRVAVDVGEAGRDQQPTRVEHVRPGGRLARADRGDAAGRDQHVGARRRARRCRRARSRRGSRGHAARRPPPRRAWVAGTSTAGGRAAVRTTP